MSLIRPRFDRRHEHRALWTLVSTDTTQPLTLEVGYAAMSPQAESGRSLTLNVMAYLSQPENKEVKKDRPKKPLVIPKNAVDVQRIQLQKLMAHPEKEVAIPEKRKEWKPHNAPEFVRHVMGSSAGAGSGEFHVYRKLRRFEQDRDKWIEEQAKKEEEMQNFQEKLLSQKSEAEARTAKKRAKRQKIKQKQMQKKARGSDHPSLQGVEGKGSKEIEHSSSLESDQGGPDP